MNQSNQPANDAPVTLINVFEMPTEHVEAFIAGWRERAALMSSKPGFPDARLHRATSPQTRFQLVNVAHRETREAMHAATEAAQPGGRLAVDGGSPVGVGHRDATPPGRAGFCGAVAVRARGADRAAADRLAVRRLPRCPQP